LRARFALEIAVGAARIEAAPGGGGIAAGVAGVGQPRPAHGFDVDLSARERALELRGNEASLAKSLPRFLFVRLLGAARRDERGQHEPDDELNQILHGKLLGGDAR
jgi:hypothetical protein